MVDWLVFQKLPVADPKTLTYLGMALPGGASHNDPQFSFREYQEIEQQCATQFVGMAAAAFGGSSGGQVSSDGLTYQGKTHPVQTYFVTGNFFTLLGLKPALGRFFESREGQTAGADPVTVLSWEYWHSQFHDDPTIIGRNVAINGHPVTIVGVGPKGFVGPTPLLRIQAFLPLGMLVIDAGTPSDFLNKVDVRPLIVLARLKHGSVPEQVRPALNVVGKHLLARYPRPDEKPDGMRAVPLRPPGLMSSTGANPLVRAAAFFFTLGILVLLLACMNVANLLLVRATARQAEMAVRAALGAARPRLLRQLLTESLLLALLGCAAGIGIGLVTTRLLTAIHIPTALPVSFDFRFNWMVFAVAVVAAFLSSLVVGIAPALRASRTHLNSVLHDSGRSVTSRRQRLRNVMVAVQVAGSLSLLIVAGLFTRSLHSAEHADLGFDPHQVTNITVEPNQVGYPQAKAEAFYQDHYCSVSGHCLAWRPQACLHGRPWVIPNMGAGSTFQTFHPFRASLIPARCSMQSARDISRPCVFQFGAAVILQRVTPPQRLMWPSSIRPWRINTGPNRTRLGDSFPCLMLPSIRFTLSVWSEISAWSILTAPLIQRISFLSHSTTFLP